MTSRNLGRMITAMVALCVAVVGLAAPAHARPTPTPDTNVLDTISPTPQRITPTGDTVALMHKALVVSTDKTDPAAVDVVMQALRNVGVKQVSRSSDPEPVNNGTFVVYVGGPQENPASAPARSRFAPTAMGPDGLVSGGYVLAIGQQRGRKAAVLAGVDPAGTFYAAQTFRQLLAGDPHRLPGVVIRDWPQIAVRGGQESFYGTKWSLADELAQMDFLAQHKQNAFLYHPRTADPYNAEEKWRDLYPPARLAELRTLVQRGARQHVDFIYRLGPEAPTAPGYGICHSDPADLQAIIGRFDQLWSIGVRDLSLGWDDSHGGFVCDADEQMFGADADPKAAAQAYVTNYVYEHFTTTHPGSRLIVIPTKYYGTKPNTYTERLSALMTQHVTVYWTGTSVKSPAITAADARAAEQVWNDRPLWIFDNYPVNDYSHESLHLGPLVNRDPGLASVVQGFTSNEMNQMAPSLLALFTSADFTWNPDAYDPETSWERALHELAGNEDAYRALRILADNSRFSPLSSAESTTVGPMIDALWAAVEQGTDLTHPAAQLTSYFAAMQQAPATLRAKMADQTFVDEAGPWLDDLELYGKAGQVAVKLVLARQSGDDDAVQAYQATLDHDRDILHASKQVLGTGVLEPFLLRASGSKNLALGQPVTASSVKSDVRIPSYAVDGDLNTRWASIYHQPEWLQFDLGSSVPIKNVSLFWETAYAKAYRLQVSDDASHWTTIYTTTDSDGGTDEITNLAGHGRYVRIQLDDRATKWGFSLWEVRVYSR